MTLRERLLAIFKGEKPDILPWYADLQYWMDVHREKGDLPAAYQATKPSRQGVAFLHRDLGAGMFRSALKLERQLPTQGEGIVFMEKKRKKMAELFG